MFTSRTAFEPLLITYVVNLKRSIPSVPVILAHSPVFFRWRYTSAKTVRFAYLRSSPSKFLYNPLHRFWISSPESKPPLKAVRNAPCVTPLFSSSGNKSMHWYAAFTASTAVLHANAASASTAFARIPAAESLPPPPSAGARTAVTATRPGGDVFALFAASPRACVAVHPGSFDRERFLGGV